MDMMTTRSELILDLDGVATRGEFHERVASVLLFPRDYEHNLDAFWYCLTEILSPVHVVIRGHYDLPECLRNYVSRYMDVLLEHQAETGGSFSVKIESPVLALAS